MSRSQADLHSEPIPHPSADRGSVEGPRVSRIGRVRVPLTLTHAPWATLFRFPDGRLLWVVRLWEHQRPVRRVVATSTLTHYARASGLRELEEAIHRLLTRASVDRASGP